ncbi:hypothetical protein L4X63_19315 [Geomonas sp. Red32]|uniref:hypothetical protein n=1 Tax=Geomonas sp. Red32 TaxID=2912856 RepID=UPI00202CB5DE|nr:hypothetical protein [Geomonas sp. Red32]MCM0083742.1 hypothetical protein [Geomonas sp. Red32]
MDTLIDQQEVELMKDIFGFMGSLARESERAAVILAAARIDVDLEALLKHVLLPHPSGVDSLFDTDRALGTFSSEIALAHRLGLISPDFEHALQMLRKVRNDFAHDLQDQALGTTRQKSRLYEIIRWAHQSDIYQTNLKILLESTKTPEHAQFVACTICMAVLLKCGIYRFTRVNFGRPLGLSRSARPPHPFSRPPTDEEEESSGLPKSSQELACDSES